MANRTLRDLPVTTTIASADLVHTSQSTTDKSVTQGKNAEYVMNLSAYTPDVVAVTGVTHTISTTINKQLIVCTIAGNCTMTFPGAFGDNQEITILNVIGSTANVIGLPNSEVLYPGQEITFVWNGAAWIKKQFVTNFITGTAAPTITPNYIGQIFIDGTNNTVYVSVGTGSATDWLELLDKISNIKSTAIDYVILDNDSYDVIENAHTSSTGLITITLPTVSDNSGRKIRIYNSGNGLTKIDGEGAETISYKGNALNIFYLYLEDDYVDILDNGTEWKIESCYSHIVLGMINSNDYTNRHLGSSNFVYDNQSDSTDLTGQHFTEATSNNTGIVLLDSAPAGNAGTLTVYFVSGTGIFTDGRVITFGDARTCDVNEGTTNKNDDNNITHNMGVNLIDYKSRIFISSDGTWNNAIENINTNEASAGILGITSYQVDTNNLTQQVAFNGLLIIDTDGTTLIIDNEDYYYDQIIEFSI